jgi:hypothetical protein
VVDHTADLDAQVRAAAPEGVPAIIHLGGDLAQLAGLLSAGGRMSTTLGIAADQLPAVPAVNADSSTGTLTRLAADAAGGLRVPITRTYAFDDAPQALTDFTASKLGKLCRHKSEE